MANDALLNRGYPMMTLMRVVFGHIAAFITGCAIVFFTHTVWLNHLLRGTKFADFSGFPRRLLMMATIYAAGFYVGIGFARRDPRSQFSMRPRFAISLAAGIVTCSAWCSPTFLFLYFVAYHPRRFQFLHGDLIPRVLAVAYLAYCAACLYLAGIYSKTLIWKARPDVTLCMHWGYDLRATPERCPECGTIPLSKPSARS